MKDLNRVHTWPLEPFPAGASIWIRMLGVLTGCGESRYESLPDCFCPHIVMRGQGVVETSNGRFPVGAGDAFTLWPGIHIACSEAPEAPWEVSWFYVTGNGAAAWMRSCGFAADRPVRHPSDPDRVRTEVSRIHELYAGRRPEDASRILSLLYALAADMGGGDVPEAKPADAAERIVAQAVALTEGMLASAINVDQIAANIGIDRTTLFRAFRKQLGRPPIEYLSQVRIRKAQDLLQQTDLEIQAVARAAGFANVKYFFRRFRQITGQTPMQCRRSRRAAPSE